MWAIGFMEHSFTVKQGAEVLGARRTGNGYGYGSLMTETCNVVMLAEQIDRSITCFINEL